MVFGAGLGLFDTSFQEVSGITSELNTEEVVEGGENRFVHRLPKGAKHPLLELKRGIAPAWSPLVIWCSAVMGLDFMVPVTPMDVGVYLMNTERIPIRAWAFANAYPVKWEVESFGSTKNEVAIEKISLSYTYSYRII